MSTLRSASGRPSFRRDARAALGVAQAWGAAGLVAALTIGGALVVNADVFEQRLHRTTQQSVDDLALGLGFGGATGVVEQGPEGPRVGRLRLDVRVTDGAETVDLRSVVVRASDGDRLATLAYGNASVAGGSLFRVEAALDEDGGTQNGTIGRGDVVDLVFDLAAVDLSLGPRESLSLRFQSGTGPAMEVEVHAPASFAADRIVTLEREVRRGK